MKIKNNFNLWSEYLDIFYSTAPKNDLIFYFNFCKNFGGNILEFGAGTGRISIPIARSGMKITAIDISQNMLNQLSKKIYGESFAKKIKLIHGYMKEIKLNERFSLVIIPARTLLLEDNEKDQIKVLENAKRHLKKSGRIIFDVYFPDQKMINSNKDEEFLLGVYKDIKNDFRYVMTGKNYFDKKTQINYCKQYLEKIDSSGKVVNKILLPVKTRYLYPEQVITLCEKSGLTLLNYYGDFNYGEINENSDDMVFICTK